MSASADSEELRFRAVELLTELGEAEEGIPVLVELAALGDGSEVQQQAIHLIVKLAQTYGNEKVRLGAVEALGSLGEQAIPALADLSVSAESPQLRFGAVEALIDMGEASTAALIDLAESSGDNRRIYDRCAERHRR